jgi:adenine-specific DNA glycosylase
LWEFPHEEVREAESAEEAAIRVARALSGEQETAEAKRIGELKHSVTRYRITLSCYEMSVEQPRHESGFYVQGKWLQAEELIVYPVSSPQRRLAKLIQKRRQQPELFD